MKTKHFLCALALLLGAAGTARADQLEDLLVERGVITRAEANQAAPGTAAPKLYYNEGVRLEFPDQKFDMRINTLTIARYAYTDADQDALRADTSSFDVAQARLVVSGTALSKEFAYLIQTDFVGSRDSGRKEPDLRDAFIDWSPDPLFSLRLGQFRLLYPRTGLNSDAKLQFPIRPETFTQFDEGRQPGAVFSSDLAGGKLKLQSAIFTGSSAGEGFNGTGLDNDHLYMAGGRVNVLGKMNPYEEGDISMSADPALSMGAYYSFSDANLATPTVQPTSLTQVDAHTATIDANFKYQGFSAHGEGFWREVEPESGLSSEAYGWYLQSGYMVIPSKLELAARYSMVDCDNGAAPGRCAGLDTSSEASLSVNYFWWKHQLKAQLGYDHIMDERASGSSGTDITTNRWIFQLVGYL